MKCSARWRIRRAGICRIIALADEVLGLNGALIDAREAMGQSTESVAEAPLTELSLD